MWLKKGITVIAICMAASSLVQAQSNSIIPSSFKNPPAENHIYTWWHFIDGYITKEGITKDLEAMHKQGIHSATILNANTFKNQLFKATVKFGSPQWYDMFKYTLKEAKRLGMEIGVSNCDGWSESGGPWITPENSMKQYVWRKSFVEGGKDVQVKLNEPIGNNNFYKDAAVVAYRSSKPNSFELARPAITISGNHDDMAMLIDGTPTSFINVQANKSILLKFNRDFTAEVLSVLMERVRANGKQQVAFTIEASADGTSFTRVAKVTDTLLNDAAMLPFPKTTAKYFRITVNDEKESGAEVPVGEIALLQNGERAMYQPSIKSLQAKSVLVQADNLQEIYNYRANKSESNKINNTTDVIDLTGKMQPDGTLKWQAPAGDWTIIRFGYTTTGKTNHPASDEGTGLECDKMDTAAVNIHFNSFPQKMIDAAGVYKGNTFSYFLIDSWEAMLQNWTGNFKAEFRKRRGYDMTPYIPVLCGEVVENTERSEAFLHDYRLTIADLIEAYYCKHIADLCHRQGMKLAAETIYGGVIYPPLDILKSYRYYDVPMTEFWARFNAVDTPYLFFPKSRLNHSMATHAAFLYNKPVVAAESYTGLALYSDSPWDIKMFGDNAFTQGVNRITLHSYVHQPDEKSPGVTLGVYGLAFNRHNTWWPYASSYFDEQARVQYLLQKGKAVPDVLVYVGDEMPFRELDNRNELLSSGIKFNYCNADVLYNRITVKDGKLWLDHSSQFQYLLIQDDMLSLATLQKIESLVNQGAVVVAPRPLKTLSLQNLDQNNAALQSLAAKLWGHIDGKTVVENAYGKGKIIWGKSLNAMLQEETFVPDFQVKGARLDDMMYIHKKIGENEVYYIVNNTNYPAQIEAGFRIAGKAPSVWDPTDGSVYEPALYSATKNVTVIPLSLRPKQSVFVVFRPGLVKPHFVKMSGPSGSQLFPSDGSAVKQVPAVYFDKDGQVKVAAEAGGTYSLSTGKGKTLSVRLQNVRQQTITEPNGTVYFESEPGYGAVRLEKFSSFTAAADPLIKYYSGVATYRLNLNLPADYLNSNNQVYLQLDAFGTTANIVMNNKQVSTIWEPSRKVNITPYAKIGTNSLIIKVTNPWRNRLIGDMINPRGAKNAWTTSPFKDQNKPNSDIVVNKTSVLLNSGISRPIKIYSVNTAKIRL